MNIILADNQDITYAGLVKILGDLGYKKTQRATNRQELVAELIKESDSLIILDYSLFDFPYIDMLLIINSRFGNAKWLLFSDDINHNMIYRLTTNENNFGFIRKSDSIEDISRAIEMSLIGHRHISSDIMSILNFNNETTKIPLTSTEKEILAAIAQGKSSREIAESRYSSLNTIVTHRKNIFRKINVNNVYEATRYALRMGIISQADYNI